MSKNPFLINLGLKPKIEKLQFDLGMDTKKWKKPLDVKLDFGLKNKEIKYERVPVTSEQKRAVLFRQKDKCAWPKCRIHFHRDGVPPHFDHIKRVVKGGKSSIDNVQALCPNHHQLKTHKENLKEIGKMRKKPKIKKENDVLGLGKMFGKQP